MMIDTVHIYYSKHGASDVEHFEMTYSNDCGEGMTAQKQGPPSLHSKKVNVLKLNLDFILNFRNCEKEK